MKFHWAPYCKGSQEEPSASGGIDEVMDDQEQENRLGGGRRAIIVTAFGVWDAVHGTCDESALSACADVVAKLANVTQFPTTGTGAVVNNDAFPPVVFLLQNNPFLPDSKEDAFLNKLHQVQRQAVQNNEDGVHIVRDRDSVYKRMSCYRMTDTIHFWDPVKLVEGKMLWDLIALAAGVDI